MMNCKSLNPRISVLVLTRNRLGVLRHCVRSILRQEYRDFEVVILDDGSEKTDTAAAVAAEFVDPRVRPYRFDSNSGVAEGRNFLMREARGEILVSIDDDAVFTSDDALDRIHRCFAKDATVGTAAFKIINVVNGRRTPLVPFSQALLARDPDVVTRPVAVSSFRGGGHAIRKRLFEQLGGYRDDMFFGEEELDLAYRIIQSGHRIVYEPSVQVDHFPMPSLVGGRKVHASIELFYHVRNRGYLAYRYLPWRYALPYCTIWMLRYAVRGIRGDGVFNFFRGALAIPRFVRGIRREVLDRRALAYLTQHGGRLWY